VDELTLVAKMRVVLGLATLLTALVDPGGARTPHPLLVLGLGAYILQAAIILACSQTGRHLHHPRLSHWLDVGWFTLLLAAAGPLSGVYILFFFAIATAAFRWGYDEGARVTLACSFLYLLSCVGHMSNALLANVLLRAVFLLALGRMVSHWGEALLDNRRRIALLRDVSRLSNPRFGVDHTIASVLERTRDFFGATSCFVLIRDHDMGNWRLRSAGNRRSESLAAQCLDEEVASLLARVAPRSSAVYTAPWHARLPWGESLHIRDDGAGSWQVAEQEAGRALAELVDARSFICAPIPLRQDEGRIFVVSSRRDLRKDDAAFLAQVAAQAFPVIENIALLDRMASDAGRRERLKFSNDLHDSTVQPYIGLSHALQALLRAAGPENPLTQDIRKVAGMADSVVRDLRRFSSAAREAPASGESAFLLALRSHAAHVKTYHNLDVDLDGDEAIDINDRLAAEIVQLVREGISNIRRHTSATRAAVRLQRGDGWLHIRIENDCPAGPPVPFTPRSISERAALLGGVAYVGNSAHATSVHVDIPL
jgi:signal transduction histidine kinase